MTEIVILAAGKGTRMRSDLPKVLHTLADKPFLQHVIDTSKSVKASKIAIVVGHGADKVKNGVIGEDLIFVEQARQLGTGHAVAQALPEISEDQVVLILYGDVPLISSETLSKLIALVSEDTMGLLTYTFEDPSGYGRIVRNDNGEVASIVEQKDASDTQLEIKEINTGVMAVMGRHLHRWLPSLSDDNAQGEYYLTDIIAIAVSEGVTIQTVSAASEIEITGVNNRRQQASLERSFQAYQAEELLDAGMSLADPARFDLRGEIKHGSDCRIDINCIFEGQIKLGDRVSIGPNCVIKNAELGDDVEIKANSIIEDAVLASDCVVGPFARLRPGTSLETGAKIGNFVETKKTTVGKGSKINHLSYVGDAELGENVNVGAGTITCNYDGVNKSKTIIDDDAFIGSNSALVAPVKVGKGVTVGAGSVVTKNSEESQLVITRAKQRNIDGWERPKKK